MLTLESVYWNRHSLGHTWCTSHCMGQKWSLSCWTLLLSLQLPIAVECDASHEQMSGHRAVVEEILQTFCQICLRAVTAQRDVSLTVFYCLWLTCDHDYKLECSTANCLPFIANGLFFSTKLRALLCHCGSVPSSVAWLFTNMAEM